MTFSLATKSARGKSSSCRFSFSAARNAITKATDYSAFSFWEILNVIAYRRYGFFSVLVKQLWIAKSEGSAIHLSTRPSGAKCE